VEVFLVGRVAWQRLFAERPALIPPAGFHPDVYDRRNVRSSSGGAAAGVEVKRSAPRVMAAPLTMAPRSAVARLG
jgi:hypothetical protein